MTPATFKVVERLEAMPKVGAPYAGGSELSRRNPIREDTGQYLQGLVIARRPQRLLELGTAYGLSGMYLASALPAGGHMDTIEFEAEVAVEAQQNFIKAGLSVKVWSGDANLLIPKIKVDDNGRHRGRYSCVFLDADKRAYNRHLLMLINQDMLMPDCLIIADNVIDRQKEVSGWGSGQYLADEDFLGLMQDYPHIIINTKCGLLVGRI